MRFLRTAPTSRLLAVIAGLVAAIAATTAIAVAASGTGQVPKREPLATALHQALKAPAVQGITADITFTNHLIDASSIQGSDPILTGATGRLWLGDHQLRLELQSNSGDAQIVVNHRSFWISDPMLNSVYEGTLPADLMKSAQGSHAAAHGIPSIARITTFLGKLVKHLNLSGAIPGNVGGQPAYTVSVSPRHDGGLLGSAEIAWDAIRGVPLRFAIYARGNSTPVLELKADNISYGPVAASNFNVAPPVGAKVVKIATATTASDPSRAAGHRLHQTVVDGVAAVAAKLPFALHAPSALVALPRHGVSLLDWGGKPAALVTYGSGLGGIAVIEQSATSTAAGKGQGQSSSDHGGLSLPTVSINGATGQELDTALGTLLRFTRGGVAYTVLGSVPSAAAEAAARGL